VSDVKVSNLSFGYYKKVVLKEISFELDRGQVLTILGPNGSGKTTLLKCLNRLLKPEGSIFIAASDISRLNFQRLARLIGYLPQMHSPVFPYKVIDVVVSGRTPYLGVSAPSEEDYKLAYQALEQVGLSALYDRPYTQVSGGELRLILIARALTQQPAVLLLDEPTSHLDIKNRMSVLKALRAVANRGVSIIMSEHDPNIASIFSDEVLLVHEGKVVSYGTRYDVLTEENMKKVYGVGIEIFERNGNRYLFPIL
jgi:iron complex transport system ATP-binding protein